MDHILNMELIGEGDTALIRFHSNDITHLLIPFHTSITELIIMVGAIYDLICGSLDANNILSMAEVCFAYYNPLLQMFEDQAGQHLPIHSSNFTFQIDEEDKIVMKYMPFNIALRFDKDPQLVLRVWERLLQLIIEGEGPVWLVFVVLQTFLIANQLL